ncbi:hypothetical protein SAMN06264365_14912 [Actinoplanes regularis]|uniref:Uncharacterized protein n=1 Tax=Actinoplanes regularis TaxID=52697 RepID=A0A239KJ27_9ACTN|nr:hypothetical protein Are01nite_89720 [Actinoplanes regularis]SNT17154.1 hypothetical protein SAMN06264365_14912 [Actinoplanes regularis]
MHTLLTAFHDGALLTSVSALVYTATVTAAAVTALLARTPQRRRDSRAVLTILLRRRHADDHSYLHSNIGRHPQPADTGTITPPSTPSGEN